MMPKKQFKSWLIKGNKKIWLYKVKNIEIITLIQLFVYFFYVYARKYSLCRSNFKNTHTVALFYYEISPVKALYDSADYKESVSIKSIQEIAETKIKELEQILSSQINEYVAARIESLDERSKLLDVAEDGLVIEYDSFELDRRDNQILRAYISYVQEHAAV